MRIEEARGQGELIFPGTIWSRIVKGFCANVVGQGINVASKILLVPLFLHAWGPERYGEWLILSSLVAYLSLTDLGGQVYIVNRLTQAYARSDVALFRKVLHSGMALFLILPMAVFCLFVLFISVYPIEYWLGVVQTPHRKAVMILALLAAQHLIALPQGILLGVYRSIGLLPTGVMLANLLTLVHLALTAAAIFVGAGMVALAAIQIVPYALLASVAMIDLQRRSPHLGVLSLREASVPMMRSFVGPSAQFFSIQISQLLTSQGTLLIAGAALGSVPVVVFSVLRTIAYSIKQLLSALTHTAWPEMTRLDARSEEPCLYKLVRFVLRTSLAGGFLCITIFHFWGQDIVQLWLGDAFEYRQHLMDLMVLYVLQLVCWTACSHVLMATNAHRELSTIMLSASMLTLLASYLGSHYLGIEGLIIGMISADVVLPLWLVPRLLAVYQPVFTVGFFLAETLPCAIAVLLTFIFPTSWPLLSVVMLYWWWQSVSAVRLVQVQRNAI